MHELIAPTPRLRMRGDRTVGARIIEMELLEFASPSLLLPFFLLFKTHHNMQELTITTDF